MSRNTPIWCALTIAVLIHCQCAPRLHPRWSTWSGKGLTIVANDLRTNTAASLFGLKTLENGWFGNSVFSFTGSFNSMGIRLEVKNHTEAPLVFSWKKSIIVDKEGWTHSIVHPELSLWGEGVDLPDVIIAPYSRRIVFVIPCMMMGSEWNRPRSVGGFHPTIVDVRKGQSSLRLGLSFRYRNEDLYYDFGFEMFDSEELAKNEKQARAKSKDR